MNLFATWYNFCRIHDALQVTPVIEAGLTDTRHDMSLIEEIITKRDPKSQKPGPEKGTRDRKRVSTSKCDLAVRSHPTNGKVLAID